MFAGKKSAQIREILISESAWEEMTCLFAPSLIFRGFILHFSHLIRAKSEFAASDNVKYHLMETLRRMTIFVIGTLGVLILVLMEGDY